MQPSGCGSKYTAYFYFISYTMIVTFIFLNLFIAIILEGFDDTNEAENMPVQEHDIHTFQLAWMNYDPEGKGFIKVEFLDSLVKDLISAECELIPARKWFSSNNKAR